MNILTNIVNQLTESSVSLTTTFLKIKVFASRLNNVTLLMWVDKELTGYKDKDVFPDYRIYDCNIVGDLTNGRWKLTSHVVSLETLEPSIRKSLEEFKIYYGISGMEDLVKDDKTDRVSLSLPPYVLNYLSEHYQNMGNSYAEFYSASKQLSIGAINNTLSIIRNKALDLMLALEREYGYEIDMNDLVKQKAAVNHTIYNIMNNTINNQGNNNIINTGDDSDMINSLS